MASIFTSVTTNKSGVIVRGVRILRSEYDKSSKRDNLKYLGTVPQGVLNIPPEIAKLLTPHEQDELTDKLVVAAKSYWRQRIGELAKQLAEAELAAAVIAPLEANPNAEGVPTYGRASR